MKLDEVVFKALLALVAASIGVNSYFVKVKVDEISADLRSLSGSYHGLRVENASRDALIGAVRARVEILEIKTEKLSERMQGEIKPGR